MKNLILFFLFAFASFVSIGQDSAPKDDLKITDNANFARSEIALFLGLSNSGTDTHSWATDNEGLFVRTGFAYGLNYTYNFNPAIGLRINYTGTTISGDDLDLDEKEVPLVPRAYNFESPLHEIGLNLKWNVIETRNLKNGKYEKFFSPYILAGGALSYTNPEVDFSGTPRPERNANDIENTKNWYFQIPYGIGIKYVVNPAFYLSAEMRSVLPLNDYLDGISESGNPDQNDSYIFGGLNIGYKFLKPDMDGDGIVDEHDNCPEVFGLAIFNGCPDTDGDGIIDGEDDCPMIPGPITLKGCPDSDGDGVADKYDGCKDTKGLVQFGGCPDTDGDGIMDKEDECPQVKGVVAFKGCPADTDGDGFIDAKDNCPDVAGTLMGCPDTDGDGVADINDNCPKIKGKLKGCPDTDKDGVADISDKCPKTPGLVSNNGCPEVKKEVKEKILNIAKAIYFKTGSDVLTTSSKNQLKELVAILNEYSKMDMLIEGHTDSTGDDAKNMTLSEKRANAVKAYLVSRGINVNRFIAAGFGETKPIGDNSTNSGRKLNRRVELSSVFK